MTAKTQGAHHVGLSVPDLAAATAFFVEGLGFEEAGGDPDYPAVFVSDGTIMITLWHVDEGTNAATFDRHRNIGLHHLALSVPDAKALDALHAELSGRPDVAMEFAPEPLGDTPLRHMMCHGPGGIRLEFIAA